MYNAYGGLENDLLHGSTRLHLDVTGAVNIMLYAASLPDGSPGFAIWHIFPSTATAFIREFLLSINPCERGDPIHNQATYLTPALLKALSERHGVHPHVIHQYPGVAVFIPAGCPHQVRLQRS